eukprot:259089_1
MTLEPSTIGLIVYLSAMILLMIILSIHAYTISNWNDKTSFFKAVKSMKSIYGAILVHIYDTSTDIAVLISWGILTRNEVSGTKDYENINMLSLFIPAVLVIFLYRFAFFLYVQIVTRGSIYEIRFCSLRSILILLDLYIFVLVYDQFKGRYMSPCGMQKRLQTWEASFEAMPQLILGSIFLIRTYGTSLAESGNIYIIFASIIGSLISIVNKFMDDDTLRIIEKAAGFHPLYFVVLLWRFCEIIVRFSIFTLLWSVINGMYLPIYFVINFAIYFVLPRAINVNVYGTDKRINIRMEVLYTLQSVFGIVLTRNMLLVFVRFFDNLIMVAIICVFTILKFECETCYDETKRNYNQNPYIFALIIMSGACTVLSFMIYLGLYFGGVIIDGKRQYSVKIVGMDDKFTSNPTQARLEQFAQIYPKAGIKMQQQEQRIFPKVGITSERTNAGL